MTDPQPSTPPAPPEATLPEANDKARPVSGTPLRTIAGYTIEDELGRGGMGIVYRARQKGLGRSVALKMILHADHASPEERLRFLREAESLARLRHENIVQVYEVGEHEGKPYFSLEYVEGGSLDEHLRGTPLPPRDAARLVQQLAVAMQAAHEQGIIHRDLKPANVLLASGGRKPPESAAVSGGLRPPLAHSMPKITDFGLAKRQDEGGLSVSGAVVGTPSYMAPEQAAGKNRAIDARTDVYALGALLYECLTGRPPFRAATALDTLLQVIQDEPVAVRSLQPATPQDLETVCLKCLQKEPGKRYQAAGEVAAELGRFLAGEPVQARPVGRLERGWRWCKRNPLVAGLLLAVSLTLGVGASVATLFAVRAEDKAQEAMHARRAEATRAEEERKAKEQVKAEKANVESQKALAESRLRDVLVGQQDYLDRSFATQSNRQRLESLGQARFTLSAYVSTAVEMGLPPSQLYDGLVHWKGVTAARYTQERLARESPALQPLVERLNRGRAELARRIFTPTGVSGSKALDLIEDEKERLEVLLARQSGHLRGKVGPPRQGFSRELSGSLPPRTALIDFFEYDHTSPSPGASRLQRESRLVAFVLRPGREPAFVSLGEGAPVARAAKAWRAAVTETAPVARVSKGGRTGVDAGRGEIPGARELARLVWKPLEEHLGGVETVLISPAGPLHGVSFAALPGRNPGSYLLEELTIGYVNSAQQILLERTASAAPGTSLLAVAGVDYAAGPALAPVGPGQAPERGAGDSPPFRFYPLPGTLQEIAWVTGAFRKAWAGDRLTLLTGREAGVAPFRRTVSAGAGKHPWRYIHIATHSFVLNPGLPGSRMLDPGVRAVVERNHLLRPVLVFAGANRSPEGFLTAEEVAGLDLRGVELVVLSSCDTGLGQAVEGEGVLSMQQAFRLAGARNVLASLFNIDDRATAVLLKLFYRELWQEKRSPLAALRRAQLTLHSHPEVLTGDTTKHRGVGEVVPIPQEARRDVRLWASFVMSGVGE